MGGEWERGEKTSMCERNINRSTIVCLSHTLNEVPGPRPRRVLTGIKPVTLPSAGRRPTHWATPAGALFPCFKCNFALSIYLLISEGTDSFWIINPFKKLHRKKKSCKPNNAVKSKVHFGEKLLNYQAITNRRAKFFIMADNNLISLIYFD